MLKFARRLPVRGGRAHGDRARARRAGRDRAARLGRGAHELQRRRRRVYVDPAVSRYASRSRSRRGSLESSGSASSRIRRVRRQPARADQPRARRPGARAAPRPPLRVPQDVRELAKDVLRHRMVLSYEALAEGVEADTVLDRVFEDGRDAARRPRRGSGRMSARRAAALAPVRTPGRPGPGPLPGALLRQLDLTVAGGSTACSRRPPAGVRRRRRAGAGAAVRARRRRAPDRLERDRANRRAARPLHVAERPSRRGSCSTRRRR